VSTLLAVIVNIIGFDVTDPINCQVSVVLILSSRSRSDRYNLKAWVTFELVSSSDGCLEESAQRLGSDLCLHCLLLGFVVDCASHVRPPYVKTIALKQGAYSYPQNRYLEQKQNNHCDCE
jgi:hypothetical protein